MKNTSERRNGMKIGERIRAIRLLQGMSQGDIWVRSGLERCYLSRVECGYTTPTLGTLARLAAAMDVPLESFFSSDAPAKSLFELPPHEIEFLREMRALAPRLTGPERKTVIAWLKGAAARAERQSA